MSHPASAWGARAWLMLVYAFLYVPLLCLMVYSFTGGEITTQLDGFSLRWYEALLKDDQIQSAVWLSLRIGALAASAAVVVGSAAAFLLARFRPYFGSNFFAGMTTAPMVIDADALSLLAKSPKTLASLPPNRLLTPHPGEMARLSNESGNRVQVTRKLADEWGVTLLHKGARTAIATPGEPVELNTSGTPGMASGGMGDVLTGVSASLIAQGYSTHDAACLGSWLIGRAAECAMIREKIAAESLNATQIANHLGHALRQLQTAGSY